LRDIYPNSALLFGCLSLDPLDPAIFLSSG